MIGRLVLSVSLWLVSTSALAGETILRGPAPVWIPAVPPHLSNLPDNPSQNVRYELVESHQRAFGTYSEVYVRMRLRVLTPLGLQQASQLGLEWNPALQTPTVHHARIIRANETSDILDKADFTILRREAALEQSLQINGVLTGVLVNPDIRVGDTIDFAYSVRTQFDVFDNPLEALALGHSSLPVDLAVSTISWPTSMRVTSRTGRYVAALPVTERDGFKTLVRRVTDARGEAYPATLSTRSLPDYAWQVSSIPQWGMVADHIRPAFERASALPDAPDLAAHLTRIKSDHSTPQARAIAALRLVQDEVRYMALTLGEGGWLPASASEVWASRQGDCKGKTVLLIALLKDLGIDAVPALVSSENLALDRYLPMVSVFDHVIVKASIDGETFLLDGARLGDRSLTPDMPLVHEYVLPIVEDARLEHIPLRLPPRPTGEMHLEIDFSDGLYSPARVTLTDVDRGAKATEMQASVAQLPSAELTRLYNSRWNGFLKDYGQVSELSSQWEYREDTHEFVAKATARIAFDFSDGPINIPLAHVTWQGAAPPESGVFIEADSSRNFPNWSSFRTIVLLPQGGDVVDLSVEPYEVEAGATRYYRTVQRNGARLETERGSVTLRPYATAAEVRSEQAGMDRFKDLTATMAARRDYALTAADRQTLTTSADGNPEIALRRGYALNNEGDFAGAIAQFDAAIAGYASPNANAFANRALAHLALNDLEKARADIAAAEAVDPDETILLHAKGRLAEIEGDDLEAVLAFSGALRSWPENTHALYRRAAAYERMGQPTRALADLERIVVLQPQDNRAKTALATQLLRMGRATQAYEHLALVAQSMGYPDAKVHLLVGIAQSQASTLRTSDPAKAEALLTDVLSVEPDFPALLIDRARLRETQGDRDDATADFARFQELTRIDLADPAEVCRSRKLLIHSLDAALGICDAAIERIRDDAELHVRRGYLLYVLNREPEAVAAYRSATELDPANQEAKYGLGKMLHSTGQTTQGDALMSASLSLDSDADTDFRSTPLEVRVIE